MSNSKNWGKAVETDRSQVSEFADQGGGQDGSNGPWVDSHLNDEMLWEQAVPLSAQFLAEIVLYRTPMPGSGSATGNLLTGPGSCRARGKRPVKLEGEDGELKVISSTPPTGFSRAQVVLPVGRVLWLWFVRIAGPWWTADDGEGGTGRGNEREPGSAANGLMR